MIMGTGRTKSREGQMKVMQLHSSGVIGGSGRGGGGGMGSIPPPILKIKVIKKNLFYGNFGCFFYIYTYK